MAIGYEGGVGLEERSLQRRAHGVRVLQPKRASTKGIRDLPCEHLLHEMLTRGAFRIVDTIQLETRQLCTFSVLIMSSFPGGDPSNSRQPHELVL